MIKIILSILLLTLVSCGKETNEISRNFVLPQEMNDCKIYSLRAEDGRTLYIVRCPNASTSTIWKRQSGKNTVTEALSVVDR